MVEEFGMLHFLKTLTIDKMTSTRCLEFNDMEYLVKKYIKICHGKIIQWM
jgi:hypothetical protein